VAVGEAVCGISAGGLSGSDKGGGDPIGGSVVAVIGTERLVGSEVVGAGWGESGPAGNATKGVDGGGIEAAGADDGQGSAAAGRRAFCARVWP
jgi:hypothetical protein